MYVYMMYRCIYKRVQSVISSVCNGNKTILGISQRIIIQTEDFQMLTVCLVVWTFSWPLLYAWHNDEMGRKALFKKYRQYSLVLSVLKDITERIITNS